MSLHGDIMNIQIPENIDRVAVTDSGGIHLAYKIGHRDARHAAADLSLGYEDALEELYDVLEDVVKHHQDLDGGFRKAQALLFKHRDIRRGLLWSTK